MIEAVEALYLNPTPGLASNLCLLTTRPHGFANLSLGAGFRTATVRPFGLDDVSDFIRNWYRVAYREDALAEEAAELIAAIGNNERVEALASNPLLCTIIAVVYRNNRVLPERRVELYFKCCEALLDTWERNKDIRSSGLIGNLGWQEKLELLASLAYWMHGETERLAAPKMRSSSGSRWQSRRTSWPIAERPRMRPAGLSKQSATVRGSSKVEATVHWSSATEPFRNTWQRSISPRWATRK